MIEDDEVNMFIGFKVQDGWNCKGKFVVHQNSKSPFFIITDHKLTYWERKNEKGMFEFLLSVIYWW